MSMDTFIYTQARRYFVNPGVKLLDSRVHEYLQKVKSPRAHPVVRSQMGNRQSEWSPDRNWEFRGAFSP